MVQYMLTTHFSKILQIFISKEFSDEIHKVVKKAIGNSKGNEKEILKILQELLMPNEDAYGQISAVQICQAKKLFIVGGPYGLRTTRAAMVLARIEHSIIPKMNDSITTRSGQRIGTSALDNAPNPPEGLAKQLITLLPEGNRQKALTHFELHLKNGSDPYYIL